MDLVDVIIDEESGWNPYVGLMQLMPQTAVRFGVRNRFRIDENIRGGVAYLAHIGGAAAGMVLALLFRDRAIAVQAEAYRHAWVEHD